MLSWNIPNWITVVLMVAAGYLVFALVTQYALRLNIPPSLKAAA